MTEEVPKWKQSLPNRQRSQSSSSNPIEDGPRGSMSGEIEDVLDNIDIGKKYWVPRQPDGRTRAPLPLHTTASSNGGGRPVTRTPRPGTPSPGTPSPGTPSPGTPDPGTMKTTTTAAPNGEETNTDKADKIECQPLTSQHKEYITQNLGAVKQQCGQFQECLNELYSSVNFHTLLSGEDIRLTNICGLLNGTLGEEYTTLNERCPAKERNAIREEINNDLTQTLDNPPNDHTIQTWRQLNQCIETNKNNTEKPVATVCRMRRSNRYICNSTEVHDTTQRFFNKELEHMHCSCKAVQQLENELQGNLGRSTVLPLEARIGIGAGIVGLFVFLIVLVAVLCYKHRKVKRRLSKQQMQYMPSPLGREPSAVYQEIGDSYGMSALRNKERAVGNPLMPGYNYNYLGPAPALPDRYVKVDLSRSRENLAAPRDEECPEYLEPIPDPRFSATQPPVVSNIGYFGQERAGSGSGSRGGSGSGSGSGSGRGKSGSGRSAVEGPYHVGQLPGMMPSSPAGKPPAGAGEATYFSRIDRTASQDEDGGYSTLGRKDKGPKENSGDSGVSCSVNGGGRGALASPAEAEVDGEEEDAFGEEETRPLNQQDSSGVTRTSSRADEEPKYFVLEPERTSSPEGKTVDEGQSPGEAQRPRRYRPKRAIKDTSTVV